MASKPRGSGDSFASVVARGDLRASLEALRDELARAIEAATPGAKAQTAAQLRAVLADIAALPDVKKVSKADELAARRKARRAAAAAAASPAGEGVKRRPRSG